MNGLQSMMKQFQENGGMGMPGAGGKGGMPGLGGMPGMGRK